jgi:hypothetical protein
LADTVVAIICCFYNYTTNVECMIYRKNDASQL